MRFRFCGDTDCPDWILAEINTLSKLSSVKLKCLAQVVAQGIVNPPVDMDKAEKLFIESKLDLNIDLQACIACLFFIITSTIKYNCDHNALYSELQQLGLPREHSTSIKRITSDQFTEITAKLKGSSLKINPLQSFTADVNQETNYVLFDLVINNKSFNVIMTSFTLNFLLENLKSVRTSMKDLAINAYNL